MCSGDPTGIAPGVEGAAGSGIWASHPTARAWSPRTSRAGSFLGGREDTRPKTRDFFDRKVEPTGVYCAGEQRAKEKSFSGGFLGPLCLAIDVLPHRVRPGGLVPNFAVTPVPEVSLWKSPGGALGKAQLDLPRFCL